MTPSPKGATVEVSHKPPSGVNLIGTRTRFPDMRRQPTRRAEPASAFAEPALDQVDFVAHGAADAEPFEDFYLREFPHLTVLAGALLGPAAAEDVAQESLLVAFRRWGAIGKMRSPAGYVRGICAHKATSLARRRTLERKLWRRLTAGRPEDVSADEDELSVETRLFWSQIRALPPRQAQAAALHYALDMPVADVAEVLGCAEGTVKAHLHRARTTIAAALNLSEEHR